MNIAVVEDNRQESDMLVQFLKEYKEEHSLEMDIFCFSSGEEFVASFGNDVEYTAVFLDIFMGELDGMEAAGQLWEYDPGCLIVFLTTSREHIWEASRVHCFDYIDKRNFTRQRIFDVLTDIRRRSPHVSQYLEFVCGNRPVRVPMDKIQYILSDNNYTVFVMEQGERYRYRIPFGNILKLTEQVNFFLNCNRGVLLNMNDIVKEETDVYVMKNGQRFPIRRADRPAIKNIYHQYQFEKLENMRER
ncbi:MAG: LytTR family DNA-binding domain-containing protein [Lachnospiraceae bacterium]